MRRSLLLSLIVLILLFALPLRSNALHTTNTKPRPERLVFPNVLDDAADDTYSALIAGFVLGAVLVGGAVVLFKRKRTDPPMRRTLL